MKDQLPCVIARSPLADDVAISKLECYTKVGFLDCLVGLIRRGGPLVMTLFKAFFIIFTLF